MMRYLMIVGLVFCISYAKAYTGKERKSLEVQIVSDEFDAEVPEGKCKITGEVYFQGELKKDAEVCSYKGQECVETNKKGEFTLLVDTNEINVYASVIGAKTSYLQTYDFKSQHHLHLRFYIQEKYSAVRKPVVYLYSEERVDLKLKLITEVELSFTYPKYNEGWEINVSPETGISVDGINYPYLFWEGKDYGNLHYEMRDDVFMGQIISTDTIISFLENWTTSYGLNAQESTDFITFWGPILARKNYAFVQFLVDEDYNQIASIESSVEINSERRIFLQFESFDEVPNLDVTGSQPQVKELHRTGLTLVEWGGAEVLIEKL